MPDSNLNTSISAMRTAILNDLPTATVAELVDLSRAAKSLNLANDSTVETAINNRAVALVNGGATQAEIIKISQAVKSVLSPATFANNIANITTITSSLVPDTDVAYDLGTSSNRFNDIYLDGSTIDLGGQTIKSTATGIEVPEITIGSGTNKVKLSANSSGKLEQVGTNSGGVVQDAVTGSGPASTAVTNLSDLTAISSPATGQSVLVTSTNKLYIYNGTGWYLIAEVTNLSPTAITGLNATYDLAIDGTATTITLNSTDPEGATLTWSHAVTTGTLGSTATITNVNNVFTITPSTTEADAGSFSVTFSASDGSQAATSVSAITLAFQNDSSILFTSDGTISTHYNAGTPTQHNWVVPADVTSICTVVIGSGAGSTTADYSGWAGSAGGGGALSYVNNIAVTPGETLTVLVGVASGVVSSGRGAGGCISALRRGGTDLCSVTSSQGGRESSAIDAGTSYKSWGGNVNVGTGGDGGDGGWSTWGSDGCGGGGAGGYSGDGGTGQGDIGAGHTIVTASGGAGSGGGRHTVTNVSHSLNNGGGVSPYGEGATGAATVSYQNVHGNGGSGGSNGTNAGGGLYGGGGGGKKFQNTAGTYPLGAGGAAGCVRILWGAGRAFPSTNVDLASNIVSETVV